MANNHGSSSIGHGKKTVTTAGTDVALATSGSCSKVIIQAYNANTGFIAVGGEGVNAADANGDGILLDAGDSVEVETDALTDIYIDATVNGEGVRFFYFSSR